MDVQYMFRPCMPWAVFRLTCVKIIDLAPKIIIYRSGLSPKFVCVRLTVFVSDINISKVYSSVYVFIIEVWLYF